MPQRNSLTEPDNDAERLRRLHHDAMSPDGTRLLIRRVADAVRGRVALVDAEGALTPADTQVDAAELAAIETDLNRIRAGQARSAAVHHGDRMVSVQTIDTDPVAPILLISARAAAYQGVDRLIADVARLLWMRWRADEALRSAQRVGQAATAIREVVMHLLMLGHPDSAQRVASTLTPRLPTFLTVYVVQAGKVDRDSLAARISRITGDRAWIVHCPVYVKHLIVLVPAGEHEHHRLADAVEELVRKVVAGPDRIRVGASQVVALREVAVGYEQAFHALAAARGGTGSFEMFAFQESLAAIVGPAGESWATRILAPLRAFEPARTQDPDAEALELTLGSWLNFGTGAARQLKIHRNTLTSRIAQLERILDCDVRDLPTQARLHLALHLAARSAEPNAQQAGAQPAGVESAEADSAGPELPDLLGTSEVRAWMTRQLEPLHTAEEHLLDTLRAWLDGGARLEAAARTLELSVPAVRKRIVRIERLLERSLLHGPSVRYELHFAIRLHDDGAIEPDLAE
ncbi:helix-turn-helix domain-containing protein [Saccharopolyspora gloriosae]|uniref:helix-turn-helix domain-containing protein n=1 Tax=Saccharopolyspora gloriosae TaxID=455344 RepID=UPI002867C575|nr:helix-turn-helix domain-containing protein [Saccharopolyspora gloriosae]